MKYNFYLMCIHNQFVKITISFYMHKLFKRIENRKKKTDNFFVHLHL